MSDNPVKDMGDYIDGEIEKSQIVAYTVPGGAPPDQQTIDFGPQGVAPPPPVPGGADKPGSGVTAVSTDAMKTFAANVMTLGGSLRQARTRIGTVNVAAGGFPEGFEIKNRIVGTNGLVQTTGAFLDVAIETLTDVVNAANSLVHTYTNAEDLNGLTSQELGEFVSEARTDVNGLSGPAAGPS